MNAKQYRVAYWTLLRKEMVRIFRIWPQTLIPSFLTALLYFIIFGHVLGARIGHVVQFSYPQFIAPGLVMMAVIMNAYSNTSHSLFAEKMMRSVEEVMMSPMPPSCVLLAYVSAAVLRALLVGYAVWMIAALMGYALWSHGLLLFVVMVLTASVFALLGLLTAFYARTHDGIAVVPNFILTPLIYLGGVFYPLHQLPAFWRGLSLFNPVAHLIDLARYAMLGYQDFSLGMASVVILAIIVLLYAWCYNCHLRKDQFIRVGYE